MTPQISKLTLVYLSSYFPTWSKGLGQTFKYLKSDLCYKIYETLFDIYAVLMKSMISSSIFPWFIWILLFVFLAIFVFSTILKECNAKWNKLICSVNVIYMYDINQQENVVFQEEILQIFVKANDIACSQWIFSHSFWNVCLHKFSKRSHKVLAKKVKIL